MVKAAIDGILDNKTHTLVQNLVLLCQGGKTDDLPMSSLHSNGLLGNASVALEMGSSIFYSFHQLCNQKCPKLCVNWGNMVNI